MKWRNQKRERYQMSKTGLIGKKNNIEFRIDDYTEGFSRKSKGWYVVLTNLKTNESYNTLWGGVYFEDIEKAKEWCEKHTEVIP